MEVHLQDDANSTGSINDGGSSQQCLVEDKKLYVGEISRETTKKDLEDYFMRFGGVTEVTIFAGPSTDPPRPFAFVSFARWDSLVSVFNSIPHYINGKEVKTKSAVINPNARSIYVAGIGAKMTERELLDHFNHFGKVEKVEFAFGRSNQRSQFCLVTFEDGATVCRVCRQTGHKIGHRSCQVKNATCQEFKQALKEVRRSYRRRNSQQPPRGRAGGFFGLFNL